MTGRKWRTRFVLAAQNPFHLDGEVTYHTETRKRMIFEVVEPSLTNYGWQRYLQESLFRLVQYSDEMPAPTRREMT